jgi:hypothetical protein
MKTHIITFEEIEHLKHLCPYDYDTCVCCTYYRSYGCPCRGQTPEAIKILKEKYPEYDEFVTREINSHESTGG